MLGENFVYFFTVQGFFMGIIFGVLKSLNAEGLLLYTFFITIFFYLFSHIIIAFYYKTAVARSYFFPKDMHEEDLDMFVFEINRREKLIDSGYTLTDEATKKNKKNSNKEQS
jgi:hypothetical protein